MNYKKKELRQMEAALLAKCQELKGVHNAPFKLENLPITKRIESEIELMRMNIRLYIKNNKQNVSTTRADS